MEGIKKVSFRHLPQFGILLMVLFSFANLFGFPISGIVMPIGIISFFLYRRVTQDQHDIQALNFAHARRQLKNTSTWLWLVLPLFVSGVSFLISSNFFPAYIEYETQRVENILPVQNSMPLNLNFLTVFLFLVFALGEEIAWRGFFQRQLSFGTRFLPALLLTSFLFTIGHFATANLTLVFYGLSFTFINGCLFGLIYYKTNNIWLATIAHLLANLLELSLYSLL